MVGYFIMSAIMIWFWYDCWGVPVIAVLTKADTLKLPALNQLMREEGLTMREAKPRVVEFAAEMLRKLRARIESQLSGCKYPPKAYLTMASELWDDLILCWYWPRCVNVGMNQEGADCVSVLKCTTDALDDVELQKLVISTQQANMVLNIEYSVKQ